MTLSRRAKGLARLTSVSSLSGRVRREGLKEMAMGLLWIVIIVLLVLALLSGFGYRRYY